MDVPDVHYARAGGVAIAYQVVGGGSPDLVLSPHLTDLLTLWMSPQTRPVLDRLARETRLTIFNPRGTGLSDRPRNVSLEARMDDLTAVFDAVGTERPSLVGNGTSANTCALYAATYPERCERVALYRPFPRGLSSGDYPQLGNDEEWFLSWIRDIRETWGEREFHERQAPGLDVSRFSDPEVFEWHLWQQRLAVSPSSAADWARIAMETDITDVLASIRVPALILMRDEEEREIGEFMRDRIRDARITFVPSFYSDETIDAILEFVRGDTPPTIPEAVLATVLFTDLVGSSQRAAVAGDRVWRDVLAAHHRSVRAELRRHRGIEVDTAGDGFFCRFDGPGRAISCAHRIVAAARELQLEVRAGIHIGECEIIGDKIAGIAVVTGARISSLAGPGEVLVSSTVKDLVAGSGFVFEERGEHELKGVPGMWRLYAVADG